MIISCIIVDDEPLAVDVLKSYCEVTPSLKLLNTFNDPILALNFVNSNNVDLIFLDIEMPKLRGVDFVISLSRKRNIIFTTAYPEYALKSYDLDALDYLVKPISLPRFLKAINKLENLNQPAQVEKTPHQAETSFFVRADYENIKIHSSDLVYIEGLKDYLKLHLKDQEKPVLTLMSFKQIEKLLPQENFLRCHRSYQINKNFIDSVSKNSMVLKGKRIPIGETYKQMVLASLNIDH